MLKVRVLVLDEAVDARDDHRADRIGPHDVGIVIDFDAADRTVDAERGRQRSEQLFLRRRVREFARQRLARIAQRVFDKLLFFAAARRADCDAVARARTQRAAERIVALDIVGKQHETRRRALQVELREEGIEHFGGPEASVGAWEISAIAPSSDRCGRRTLRCRNGPPLRRSRRRPPRECSSD